MEDRKRLNSTENNGFMSMCAALNAISDAEVLEKRYPEGFSADRSVNRHE